MEYIALYLFIINVVSIMAVCTDKSAARNGEQRVSESSFWVLAVAGGSLGMYLVMRLIRHKTRKKKFMVGIPLILLTQIALAAVLLLKFF